MRLPSCLRNWGGLGALFFILGCSVPSGGYSTFETKKDLVFTTDDWPASLLADIYHPQLQGKRPAIVLIHGGGWNGNERRGDMVEIAKALAKRGYVVMNTSYRRTPNWKWPAQADDIQAAIQYLRRNSDALGIDADRIGVWGYSAGGHLALVAGADPSNQIKAIVAGAAPTDLTIWPDGKLTGLLMGGPLKGREQLYRDASPVYQITKATPPVFLYHGTKDELVVPAHVRRLEKELTKKKVPYEVFWIKGRGHMTTHLFPGGAIEAGIAFLDEAMK